MFQEFLIKTKPLPFDVKDTQDFEEVWIELLKQIYPKSKLEFITYAGFLKDEKADDVKTYLVVVNKYFMLFLETEFVTPDVLDIDVFKIEKEIFNSSLYYYSGRYPSFIMFPYITLEVRNENKEEIEEDMNFIEKNYVRKVFNKKFKKSDELFSVTDTKCEKFFYNVAKCLKMLPEEFTINLNQFALILKLLYLVGRNEKIKLEIYEREIQYKGTQPFVVLKTENNDFCHFAILFPIDMEFIK